MSSRTEADIDKEYLSSLEQKLKKLRDPKGKKSTSKALISDLAAQKEHQLFKLITTDVGSASSGFDDNFVEIQPNILQRKIAPHTCAINTQEKLRLVKHDIIQALHQELEEERKQAAEEQTDEQVTEAQAALQIMEWREVSFASLPNTFHAVCLDGPDSSFSAGVINASGKFRFINYESTATRCNWLKSKQKAVDLLEAMNVALDEIGLIEITDARMCFLEGQRYLCTSWAKLDAACNNLGQFVALFRFTDGSLEFVNKVVAKRQWAATTIIPTPVGPLYAVFVTDAAPLLYVVNKSGLKPIEFEELPESNSFADLKAARKGSITRFSRLSSGKYIWTAEGTDAGLFVISVFEKDTGRYIGRRAFRFNGAISVVSLFELEQTDSISEETVPEMLLLLSSTVGPVCIWHGTILEETLVVELIYELADTIQKDAVTSAFISKGLIFIGTYSGVFLVYQVPKGVVEMAEAIPAVFMLGLSSPIITLTSLDEAGHRIGVISTEGFHTLLYQESTSTPVTPSAIAYEDEIVLPTGEQRVELGTEARAEPPVTPTQSSSRGQSGGSGLTLRKETSSGGRRTKPENLPIDRVTFRI